MAGQHVSVVIAYSPTDLVDASVKDAFHMLLFGCLKVVPPVDKVVLLGDFNVELGGGWQSSNGMVGHHHLHHNDVSFDNRERLWIRRRLLGSAWPTPSSCTDLAIWAPGATLAPSAVVLRDRPQAAADFCSLLRNRFALLSLALLDLEAEWSTLERELYEAAGRVVGKAHPARRHKPGLTQATLALVAGKHQWLESTRPIKQAKVAENLQRAGHLRQWAQQVKSMAGVAPGRGVPGCILNNAGVPLHTLQAILDRFGEHFAGVLGGGVDISPMTHYD
ncbi:unnamed protein product [Sphagnum jensenii]|uniref:Endonuclease/exonuclease/phosphatase domain-containing protein n=1 Tax=Sphagnum jensenii TaxID=128206 RepID=A0ABP1AEZ0_9BRYO